MRLTKPEQLIKKLMLTYPDTHNSRTTTKLEIFLNEYQDYHWDADGCVAESIPLPSRTSMALEALSSSVHDLSEAINKLPEDTQDPEKQWMRQHLVSSHAHQELTLITYQHRQDRIESYVREDIGHDGRVPITRLAPRSLDHTLLGQLPESHIDPEWALAAYTVAVRILGDLINPHFAPFHAPQQGSHTPRWGDHYDALSAAADKLREHLPDDFKKLLSGVTSPEA